MIQGISRRRLPEVGDLGLIGLVVLLVNVSFIQGPTIVSTALTIPFLTFAPGYAFISAVYPRRPDPANGRSPSWPARLGVSLVMSVIIVAVIGFIFIFTTRIEPWPTIATLSLVVMLFLIVAYWRRYLIEPAHQAKPLSDVSKSLGEISGEYTPHAVGILVATILLIGAIGFVGSTPTEGESYSEVYLLTVNESEYQAAEYPTSFSSGESPSIALAIENHERYTLTYGVVVVAQGIGPNGSVTAQEEIERRSVPVSRDDRVIEEFQLDPGLIGERIRIRFLVYTGPIPSTPTQENADLGLHLWVEIEPPP